MYSNTCILYISYSDFLCNFPHREFEERLKTEEDNNAEVSSKLQEVQNKYTQEKKRMKEDQQEKQGIIKELSQQLEVHQQNFDVLKRELNQVSCLIIISSHAEEVKVFPFSFH